MRRIGILLMGWGAIAAAREVQLRPNEAVLTAAYITDAQQRREERVTPRTGWKRKARVYDHTEDGTSCYELTYSKPGREDVVSHACDYPLPSFEEDDGTRGVILGHVYGFGDAPYSR